MFCVVIIAFSMLATNMKNEETRVSAAVAEGKEAVADQDGVEHAVAEITDEELNQMIEEKGLKTIYFAGGCFWGVEEYMSRIPGVYDAASGYANGKTANPTYQDVIYNDTGHAETVRVVYDETEVTLDVLLDKLFKVVDPVSVNQQGNDRGTQYRSGVYYIDEGDREIAEHFLGELAKNYDESLAVELLPLDNFYLAEDYHQDYLVKNANGYCHIDIRNAVEEGWIE